jgi:hypothetical protein
MPYRGWYAESEAEVEAALAEIDAAAADTREHAGDEVAEQVAEQEDALARAADGFVGTVTAGDEFEQDLYQPSSRSRSTTSPARPRTSAPRGRRSTRPTGRASRRACRSRSSDPAHLLRLVADRLGVVAVGVQHVGAVVARVIDLAEAGGTVVGAPGL